MAFGARARPSAMARSASRSRGWRSSAARRSNSSTMSWRSCGVIGGLLWVAITTELPGKFSHDGRDMGSAGQGRKSGGEIFSAGGWSAQARSAGGEECGKGIAGEIGIFPLAQVGQRIEADELRIDPPGMAHDEPAIRQPVEEAGEQGGEIGVG